VALRERDLLALALRDTKPQYNRLNQAVSFTEIDDRMVRMAREQGMRGESKQRRHVWVVCSAHCNNKISRMGLILVHRH
jgi:hypothetical protein